MNNMPTPDAPGSAEQIFASLGAPGARDNRFLDSLRANGDSEMVSLISAFDWQATSIGEPVDWPASLKAMVRMALSTRHPVFIFWGSEHVCLYNDAYKASLGPEKHPAILGMRAEDAWPESWHVIGPQILQVMRGDGATWHENQLVPIWRHGSLQDVYWTYSYGPIDDESAPTGVGGVLVLTTETTLQVLEEQQVKSERERLFTLFEQAPTFMALLRGPDHVFELANPGYRQLLRHRPLIGKRLVDAVPEAAAQGYSDLLDGVVRTGKAFTAYGSKLDLEEPHGGVRELYVDFVYQPVLDDEGKVGGVFVIGADVTERKHAEVALRLKEEQLRLATEAAEIGLWDVDMVTDQLYWPARVKAMFGISAEVPVSMRDFYAGLHPDDAEATAKAFGAAVDPGARSLYDVEYRTVGREDGVIRWVAAKGRGIFDKLGVCTRVIGTAIDISSRKTNEMRLQELNETLERRVAESLAERKILADVVEGTDAFIQVVGLDFRWLAINTANANEFERIYGVRPEVGDHMLGILASQPAHRDAVGAIWTRALTGEAFTALGEFGEASRARHYEMRFRGLRGTDGTLLGAYQIAYDVTERLREQERLAAAEAALRQAQKMQAVGQLTGGIAHDFNNLLQAVRGIFELIRRRADKSDAVGALADRGLKTSDRGAKLTAQLLTFSREQAFVVKPFSARAQLAGMEDLLRTTVGSTVKIGMNLSDDEFWVCADATQFEMAVLNIAINARDAMEHVGAIDIGLRHVRVTDDLELPHGDYVRLCVTDTGPGMPPAVAARAFDPFFTTKAVGQGSGLGLSQVFGMAQRVGGTARLRTEPGAGTTVELWFKKAEEGLPERRADGAQAAERLPVARPLKVLVVDDDADVRMVLVEALAGLGHSVLEAADGARGLAALEGDPVDCLVVDFAMPGMNGAELARYAREIRPGIPILFVSGYSETGAIDKAVGSGIALLRKPFDLPSLSAALAEALQI